MTRENKKKRTEKKTAIHGIRGKCTKPICDRDSEFKINEKINQQTE